MFGGKNSTDKNIPASNFNDPDHSEEPRISQITRINQDGSEATKRALCALSESMKSIASDSQH
jgi:hypothetical protein